jgi:hypothetical protein
MRLYFVRHGESEANVLEVFSNRGLEHGLTQRGRVQTASLAQKLAGRQIIKLFTSPILRATQTAEILAEMLGVPCEFIHGGCRHSVCKKLSCALVYNRSVRTAKTVGPMVRMCPFASLVPVIGGLAFGGHRTPFSRIRMRRIIGSEHPIQKQEV